MSAASFPGFFSVATCSYAPLPMTSATRSAAPTVPGAADDSTTAASAQTAGRTARPFP